MRIMHGLGKGVPQSRCCLGKGSVTTGFLVGWVVEKMRVKDQSIRERQWWIRSSDR